MIGGPPMMMPGQTFATMPMSPPMQPLPSPAPWQRPQNAAAPQFVPQVPQGSQAMPPPQPRPRQPVLAEMAAGLPQAAEMPSAAPRFRMQAPDDIRESDSREPAVRELAMPAPEELGISAASPASSGNPLENKVDWNETRERLQTLGVKSFRVDRTPVGAFNVTFLLCEPGSRPRQVESTAGSEAEAVMLAIVETQRCVRER
jgi:hypothetical protein